MVGKPARLKGGVPLVLSKRLKTCVNFLKCKWALVTSRLHTHTPVYMCLVVTSTDPQMNLWRTQVSSQTPTIHWLVSQVVHINFSVTHESWSVLDFFIFLSFSHTHTHMGIGFLSCEMWVQFTVEIFAISHPLSLKKKNAVRTTYTMFTWLSLCQPAEAQLCIIFSHHILTLLICLTAAY